MNTIQNFKIFIKDSFPIFSRILRRILSPYIKYKNKKYRKLRNINFQDKAVKVFSQFCEALNEANIEYWLTFGTLLGAIREKGFISHDLDIDVAVFSDVDFEIMHEKLIRKGFKLSRKIEIYTNNASEVGFEKNYTKDSVSIDIFVFHKGEEYIVYTHDFLDSTTIGGLTIYNVVRRLTLPLNGFIDYTFLNNKVLIPQNYPEYLSAHYGSDYMIPNPKWTTRTSPIAKVIDGAIGIIGIK